MRPIICLFLSLFFVGGVVFYQQKNTTKTYNADMTFGHIGKKKSLADDPFDNVFHITLPSLPEEQQSVWLTYELKGVTNHSGIARSINDQTAVGGYFVSLNNHWTSQREIIKTSWLKKGDNVIRFTLPTEANYAYQIKNLKIEVISDNSPETNLVLQNEHFQVLGEKTYLKGFVKKEVAQLKIDGLDLPLHNGTFEVIHELKHKTFTDIEITHCDGTKETKRFRVNQIIPADYTKKINRVGLTKIKQIDIAHKNELANDGLTLSIPNKALEKSQNISITNLRNQDVVALNPDMVNVTKQHTAYRCLPHGTQFLQPTTIAMTYDSTLIPEGYTIHDLQTFYFDEQLKKWKALPKDTLLAHQQVLVSKTTHFTDFITGIIKVPESPETNGYSPNSIKDIKAADPTMGIVSIAPPVANNQGTANLSFPLKLPIGRNGMQPNLSISYNSEGGNGWLGLGWNLTTPSISIDTRWGVPRFNTEKETETYLFNGEQLSPLAHRGVLKDRKIDRQFYPRVEGGFAKIIRHGNHPNNYWWEVTQKDGTKHFYGGHPNKGVIENTILRDETGNIAYWSIYEVRDPNQNFVSYEYTLQKDKGLLEGAVDGKQIYLSKIIYTGQGKKEGKYSISFLRDRQESSSWTKRKDVQISGRLGFKQVSADLLQKIEIRFKETLIRSYMLNYKEGVFYKTLLESITEFDKNGKLFYTHDFEYYDEIREKRGDKFIYKPFDRKVDWYVEKDGIQGDIINPIFNKETSVIGGSESESGGYGLSATVGLLGNLASKVQSIGGNFSSSSSKGDGLISLIDINGDGLPDKVFKLGRGLAYRPNIYNHQTKQYAFGAKRPIKGAGDFSYTKTKGRSWGLEAHPADNVMLGYTKGKSTSTTSIYFSDFNGDGLVDIVANGVVFFNSINEVGDPVFTKDSGNTPSVVYSGESINEDLIIKDPKAKEKLITEFPLHDVVRMWKAPFSGNITINAPITLTSSNAAKEYELKDGIGATIQLETRELWRGKVTNYSGIPTIPSPDAVNNISVEKGDRLFFRLQSIENGLFDQVYWNPEISYRNEDSQVLDANGKQVYRYIASEDFVLTANQHILIPYDGLINVDGFLTKPITSDDIRLKIINKKTNEVIYQKTFLGEQKNNEKIELSEIAVSKLDELAFSISAESNIDWSSISWTPRIYYTSATYQDRANATKPALVFAEKELPNGEIQKDTLIQFNPIVAYSMFNRIEKKPIPFQPDSSVVEVIFNEKDTEISFLKKERLTVTIKGINKLFGKASFDVYTQKDIGNLTNHIPIPAEENIYIEYHTSNLALAKYIAANTPNEVGVHTNLREECYQFGHLYRGWGQFIYNGNKERAATKININELKIEVNANDIPNVSNMNQSEDPNSINGALDLTKSNFFMMIPEAKNKKWIGNDLFTYITSDSISSSRLGEDDIVSSLELGDGETETVHGLSAPNKINETVNESYSVSVGAGGSYSETESASILDVIDFNGDKYPDIVGVNNIQYTNARGGLESTIIKHGMDNHSSEGKAFSVSYGGGFAVAKSDNTSTAHSGKKGSQANVIATTGTANAKTANETAKETISYGGSLSYNGDKTTHSWMDINGDGLVDKVYESNKVALNIGYKFLPAEQWNHPNIRQGLSGDISGSGGLGISLFNGSIQAGFGETLTKNGTIQTLQDVNGDGLVDIVTLKCAGIEDILEGALNKETSGFVKDLANDIDQTLGILTDIPCGAKVRINTGNGFQEEIDWNEYLSIDNGSSTGESANAAITYCFPIFFLGIKICVNPKGNVGRGVSRQKSQLKDINGDGFPDFLESEDDGNLTVKMSIIGKTNLLKKVNRPMNSSIALTYSLVGNTYDMPMSKWVVDSITIFDGVEGDGPKKISSYIEYENGFQNRHERAFFGFETVKTHQLDTEHNNSVYRTTIQTFHNDNYFTKGLLKKELLQDGSGKIYIETKNEYKILDVETGREIVDDFETIHSKSVFPALINQTTNYYEGKATAGLSHRKTFQHDRLGNIIQYEDFGDGESEDYIKAIITYHNLENSYIQSIPKSIQVFTQDGLMRSRTASIDSKGNVTNIQQLLADGKSAAFDMTYDELGNLTSIERPFNYQNQRLTYTYQYDEEVATYLTQVTDSYGYTSSTAYEYSFGQTLKTTDMNGQEMIYTIDERGRPMTITGPYELANGQPYTIKFDYHPEAAVPYAETRHFDPEHEQDIITVSFTDGLGRPLQVKKTGALYSGEGQSDQVKMIVSGRVLFDAFGRRVAQYYPTTEPLGQATQLNRAFDQINPTRTQYDVLDRPIATTLPDETTTFLAYDIALDNMGYPRFQTQVIDQIGHQKEAYTDIRNRKRATTDHGPNGEIWTNFEYNAISELLAMIDDEGNTISYEYDQLGRKLSVNHPDAGMTTLTYDLAGNQLTKVTANIKKEIPNGGAIRYSYDQERLIQIDYPKNIQNQVKYHYGDAAAPHNRVGRIWLQEDASGGQEFYYDELGNAEKTIRTIIVNEANTSTYVTEMKYDTWNRIQQMTYPDGEVLEYDYNRAGKLTAMKGFKQTHPYEYVEQLSYDKFEQRVFCKYGNGTTTHYDYEPARRRLSHLKVAGKEQGMIMNNQYQYDAVSNILSIDNQVPVPSSAFALGGPAKHQFSYDKLYRLTSASAVWDGYLKEENYELEMAYDNVHNIVHKKQQHLRNGQKVNKTSYQLDYEYTTDRPHIATKIGLKNYEYDANGNLTYWKEAGTFSQRQIQWDEENRIKGISEDGYISQYTYDANGERVIKSHGGLQGVFADNAPAGLISHRENYTVYVNPYMVNTEKQFTKHYFIEGQRFLSKIGTGTFQNQKLDGSGITAGDLDYKDKIRQTKLANTDYYAALGIPPGIPTMPGYFAQPEITGEPIPPAETTDYTKAPPGWPEAIEPKDPNGPPGIPAWYIPPVQKDSVGAGYGYEGDALVVEEHQYFYHPDHLGSTSYITDFHGRVAQHTQYTAFGESFVSQHSAKESQPYLFNGKELDEETGLYYYGARYYDPVTSLWQSVDPLAEKYPAWSPYNYVLQNPLKFVDPDGRAPNTTEALNMSEHISNGKRGSFTKDGFELKSIYSIGQKLRMGLYQRGEESVLVNAGTDTDIKGFYADMIENVKQVFGYSNDTKESVKLAKIVSDILGKDADLTMVGHSKGGGEARANAVATGRNAILFNPVDSNLEGIGLNVDSYKGGIESFIVEGDILDQIVNPFIPTKQPLENKNYLPSQSTSIITNHKISSIRKAL